MKYGKQRFNYTTLEITKKLKQRRKRLAFVNSELSGDDLFD